MKPRIPSQTKPLYHRFHSFLCGALGTIVCGIAATQPAHAAREGWDGLIWSNPSEVESYLEDGVGDYGHARLV